jgi:hypothetical protein
MQWYSQASRPKVESQVHVLWSLGSAALEGDAVPQFSHQLTTTNNKKQRIQFIDNSKTNEKLEKSIAGLKKPKDTDS